MNKPHELILRVYSQLDDLRSKVVLIGGCALPCLITDTTAPPLSPTKDIDFLINCSRVEYLSNVEAKLQQLGFRHDCSDEAVFGRWKTPDDATIDVLLVEHSMSSQTPWFRAAFEQAETIRLSKDLEIAVASATYVIAMKIDAFNDRGAKDFPSSKDIEDIIALLDGRPSLANEIGESPEHVRDHIKAHFERWLRDQDFKDTIRGSTDSHQRYENIVSMMRQITSQA